MRMLDGHLVGEGKGGTLGRRDTEGGDRDTLTCVWRGGRLQRGRRIGRTDRQAR